MRSTPLNCPPSDSEVGPAEEVSSGGLVRNLKFFNMKRILYFGVLAGWLWFPALLCGQEGILPATTQLTLSGDIASNLVAGVAGSCCARLTSLSPIRSGFGIGI